MPAVIAQRAPASSMRASAGTKATERAGDRNAKDAKRTGEGASPAGDEAGVASPAGGEAGVASPAGDEAGVASPGRAAPEVGAGDEEVAACRVQRAPAVGAGDEAGVASHARRTCAIASGAADSSVSARPRPTIWRRSPNHAAPPDGGSRDVSEQVDPGCSGGRSNA